MGKGRVFGEVQLELTADEQEASQSFLSAYDVLTLAPAAASPAVRWAGSAGVGDQRTGALGWRGRGAGWPSAFEGENNRKMDAAAELAAASILQREADDGRPR